MKSPVSGAHNKLGIPQPEEGEEVLSFTPQPAPTAISRQPTRTAALRADPENDGLEDFPDQEAIDEALEAFTDGDLNEQMLPILEPVMAIAAEGPEALRDALDDLFPDMDDAKAEERLTRALFVAELWGQIHGQQ
jgi:phage gp29-like protein